MSPWIFNVLMDEIITEIKAIAVGVTDVVAYADDLAIFGRFSLLALKELLNGYALVVNDSKSVSFRRSVKGVAKRKTMKYLGCMITDKGEPRGKIKMEKKLKERARKISRVGTQNDHVGLQIDRKSVV